MNQLCTLSLMAYSSWRYAVFASFHGPDVPQAFLSHLHNQLNDNAITMFRDQVIERGKTIAPGLTQAIRESRISIVLLTKNYASSTWCLEELVEILKCREDIVHIVMTVFYGVDPSDVRKQTGDFGIAFNETCAGKTEEERRRWSQALTDVANIEGEVFRNWDNEANMIEKIARDVSNMLNPTINMIEAHLNEIHSLLHLDDEDETMIVGICGPSGIGKTTIARALHSQLSSSFQHTCFVENLRGIRYTSGLDKYGLKLQLQEQLFSKVLNQSDVRIDHLGTIQERLRDKKILIVLDDVDDLQQLEALADEISWFGPGSRIVITTKDQELLQQHGIDITYHMDLPSDEEALKILCRYAFEQSYPRSGFENLAPKVTEFFGNLPLRLREVGSSLRGKTIEEWGKVLGVKSKNRWSTVMAFLVVINLLLEITSAVSDQLSSVRKPYFARISLVMSILSVVLSTLDLKYKIRAHRARFRWRWMRIPWFYYPERNYRRIFGSYTDNTLLFCGVGQLIVSTINFSFIERRLDGPIKVSVWPLFFAIGILCSKFMEKPAIYKEN